MTNDDFPITEDDHKAGIRTSRHFISRDMVQVKDCADILNSPNPIIVEEGKMSVEISGDDYRNTLFRDDMVAEIAKIGVRPETIINPDTEIALACIQQIAIWNGKCPKKVSNGETDDVYCPCLHFIKSGKCEFGLFIEK